MNRSIDRSIDLSRLARSLPARDLNQLPVRPYLVCAGRDIVNCSCVCLATDTQTQTQARSTQTRLCSLTWRHRDHEKKSCLRCRNLFTATAPAIVSPPERARDKLFIIISFLAKRFELIGRRTKQASKQPFRHRAIDRRPLRDLQILMVSSESSAIIRWHREVSPVQLILRRSEDRHKDCVSGRRRTKAANAARFARGRAAQIRDGANGGHN